MARVLPRPPGSRDPGDGRHPGHATGPRREPYRGRAVDAPSDRAGERRGLFRPDAVECMLREPSAVRTTLGSHALWQPALPGTELQKVEDLAR